MADLNNLTTLAKRLRPLLKHGFGGGGAGGGHIIEDEGTPLPNRGYLNFVGDGVTATDDEVNNATVVTVPGGGEPICCCDIFVPVFAMVDGSGNGTLPVENGYLMPVSYKAVGYWQVPPGHTLTPIHSYILAVIPQNAVSEDMWLGMESTSSLGYCSSIVAWEWRGDCDLNISIVANPDGMEVLCGSYICTDIVNEGDYIKLTATRVVSEELPGYLDRPDYDGDLWFLGWQVWCAICGD